jgi:hypothetical protein
VTSAAEMLYPCIFDFLHVGLNDSLSVSDLAGCKARGCCQSNNWGKPELGLSIRMCCMDMDAWLFAGKEEQAEGSIAYNGRCHAPTLADSSTADVRCLIFSGASGSLRAGPQFSAFKGCCP